MTVAMKVISKNRLKIASIAAKIAQGGRLRHLLSQPPSPDQMVEDATGMRPVSSDMALRAVVPDHS